MPAAPVLRVARPCVQRAQRRSTGDGTTTAQAHGTLRLMSATTTRHKGVCVCVCVCVCACVCVYVRVCMSLPPLPSPPLCPSPCVFLSVHVKHEQAYLVPGP